MSLTLPGWLLVISLIALSALLVFSLRWYVAAVAFLTRLRSSGWGFGQTRRGPAGVLLVATSVFLLVAAIGTATSYWRAIPGAAGAGDRISQAHSGSNGETLARLKDYTRSIGTHDAASAAPPGKLLPDVNTMIDRLAARLETAPGDAKGWQMLGWS